MVIDAAAWVVAQLAVAATETERLRPSGAAVVLAVTVLAQLGSGLGFGLYRRRWPYGSIDEAGVAAVVTVVATMAALAARVAANGFSTTVVGHALLGGFVALSLMGAARAIWRRMRTRRNTPRSAEPLVVFGAGEGGGLVIRSLLSSPDSPYLPVAVLDDDPGADQRVVGGVPFAGGRDRLAAVARATGARALLIAIPSASAALVRDVSEQAQQIGLRVMVLPPVRELLGDPAARDIRPLSEADLLGRHQVVTDLAAIAGYVAGRTVLVTGAGGSIGSELCRQLQRFGPRSLVMLDRDESALHAVMLSIDGRADIEDPTVVLADIRDPKALDAIFATWKPQVVFHAAALKHLPLLERHPSEAVKTNVLGTVNLLDVAERHGVERFVNISTDKAADPSSVLGTSKRITERVTAAYAARTGLPYVSVRFGNVLGSRGSFLRTFQSQIAAGGPVTVTHPDVTRYFMTVEEAVELTIQAGAIGRAAEVLVLDMGAPVRIRDVADRLIVQADRPISIEYTGLRRGEKLHEVLFGRGEVDERPFHPQISHCAVAPIAPDQLRFLAVERVGADDLRRFSELGQAAPATLREALGGGRVRSPASAAAASPSSSAPGGDVERVFLSPPDLGRVERDLLLAALDSGWVAPVGPDLDAFEHEVAAYVGVDHAVALASGTAALHLSLRGLGVGAGDVVIVPTLTFVASANAVTYVGAEPMFVDSEPGTWNVDPDLVAAAIERVRATGRRVGAVMAVDLYGRCADYGRLEDVCAAAGVPLVEDAAEGLGARRGGRSAGSFGRAAVFSFNGNKIITTSGGGMLVSDDAELVAHARHLATQARENAAHYEHREIGHNYRMSNLLAAVGRGQLRGLEDKVQRRRSINRRYREALEPTGAFEFPTEQADERATWWLTVPLVRPGAPITPAGLRVHLEQHGVESRPAWKPMHRQPVFAGALQEVSGVADDVFARGICLPSGTRMSDADLDRVIGLILDACAGLHLDRRERAVARP